MKVLVVKAMHGDNVREAEASEEEKSHLCCSLQYWRERTMGQGRFLITLWLYLFE